ncbi:MAG: hypothetical protein K6G69_02540 [Lachnospiraceae bacterium]|nr:hypothetical protein [Lachnospiraceae bacterium]
MKKEKNKRSFKERIKGIGVTINNELIVDKLNKAEWIALTVISTLIFLTLFYMDNIAINLVYFWDVQQIFSLSGLQWLGNNRLAYGMVQQTFCHIWSLPVNIAFTIHEFMIANTITILWYKSGMVLILGFSVSEIIKIAKILGIEAERIKWLTIIFLSSVLVVLPVFHISQTDILCAYMLLIALRHALNKNKKRFLLFSALAVSCKLMALIAFIPLLLLMEKDIIKVAVDGILVAAIYPLENIWYRLVSLLENAIWGNKAVAQTVEAVQTAVAEEPQNERGMADFINHFYNKALYFEFPAIRKGYMASAMVFLLVLLCIWCYGQKKDDDKHKYVYAMAMLWLIFFSYASPSPYWIVILYPFLAILIFMKPECIRFNLILYNAYTLLMFLVYVVNTHWVYGGPANLDYLLLKGILPPGHISTAEEGPYVARYLNNLHIDKFMNVITAACLAAAVGLVVVNYRKVKIDEELSPEEERKLMHGFVIFQIAFLWLWYAFSVYAVTRW